MNLTVFVVGLVTLVIVCAVHGEKEHDIYDQSEGLVSKEAKRFKVAVIGSGIGGASTAHFLRELFGDSLHIDVYEKEDHVGGRLHVITMNGVTIESGGTVIHSSNKYMVDFATDLGLETNGRIMDSNRLGIYNGDKFVFTEGSFSWWNNIKMIWRYGLFSLRNMGKALTQMLKEFVIIYNLQDSGKAYKTVPELLKAMGGDYFVECTQKTSRRVLKEAGVGDRLIDELATAIDRCNYGQSADMLNGFTGFVSLAGAQGGSLWNVKGGNYLVPQGLLAKAKANLHLSTKITSIQKQVDPTTNKLVYSLQGTGPSLATSTAYDLVIVAVPLEVPSCYMDCPKCTNWPQPADIGQYQQTVATFIQKPVNYKWFGYKSPKDMMDVVFTMENKSLPFSTIAPQSDIHGVRVDPPLYKVFSREPLTSDTINKLFITGTSAPEYTSVPWSAYPRYTPPEKFLPFQVDDGVFYVNAVERASSAMEMISIGGRNAALLGHQYLQQSLMQSESLSEKKK